MNVLIIGLGSIARKHIDALHSLNIDVKIYALRSKPNAKNIVGVLNIYNLDSPKTVFDFAIISNPTQLHYEYIDLLADRGIDLFIEKPPVNSFIRIEKLIDKIQLKDIKTYVACNLRFHPCLIFLKEFLLQNESKRINEVNIYCGSYLPDWRVNKDFRQIYSAIPEMGGGVHLDLFHELDYTHWLFGKPLKTHSVKRNNSSLNIKASDYANFVLEYANFTASIVLNYYRRDAKRSIEILFEDETLTVDLIKNRINNNQGNVIYQAENFTIVDTYENQMKSFINSLKSDQEQMNTFVDSIEVLKTCLNNE